MKNKYINRLDTNDFSYLTRAIFDLKDYDKNSFKVEDVNTGKIEVTLSKIKQRFGETIKEDYSFGYSDFDIPLCYSHIMEVEFEKDRIRRKFYSYMIQKFGKEYIADLIQYKYKVDSEVINSCLKN